MRFITHLIILCSVSLIKGALSAEVPNLPKLFAELNPSVVTIYTQTARTAPFGQDFETKDQSLGSGVIISSEGSILTASHVVYNADEIEVELASGKRLQAYVVAASRIADVALIQINTPGVRGLPMARLGESDETQIGESIFVIGAPYGLEHTLTSGIISQKTTQKTPIPGFMAPEFIQTDAAINQGNSGGPMFNMNGEVIGIVSHIRSKSGGYEGLGFAVSTKTAKQLVIDNRNFYSGIDIHLLTGPIAEALNIGQAYGLLVQGVAKRSPAARLDLKEGYIPVKIANEEILIGGDVIIEAQGIPLDSPEAFMAVVQSLSKLEIGETYTLKVLRAGEVVELSAPYFK